MWKSFRRWVGGTADAHVGELHDVLMRSARRCAYDLRHATDHISDKGTRDVYRGRAEMWVGMFASGNSMKDYRLEWHRELQKKEFEIERLKRLCRDKGIDPEDPNRLPF